MVNVVNVVNVERRIIILNIDIEMLTINSKERKHNASWITVQAQTKDLHLQTNNVWVWMSGKFPKDLGIPPLQIKNLPESKPPKSRLFSDLWYRFLWVGGGTTTLEKKPLWKMRSQSTKLGAEEQLLPWIA